MNNKKIPLKSNKVVALSGKIASGKSFCLAEFSKLGFNILSADQITAKLYQDQSICDKVTSKLPETLVDGKLDKKRLSEVVFSNDKKRKILESILLPEIARIRDEEIKSIQTTSDKTIIYEIPLLYETNQVEQFDFVINIICPQDIRLARALKRNNMTTELFNAIDSKQVDDSYRIEHSDFIIRSSFDKDDYKRQILQIVEL